MALTNVPSLRDLPNEKQLEKIHKYLMSLKSDLEYELSTLDDAANQVRTDLNLEGLFAILGIDGTDIAEWDKIKQITDNVGKVVGEKIAGMIDLANTRISTTTAHISFDEHGMFFMDKETIMQSTWAMQIGPAGFRIARDKIMDAPLVYSWDWSTFGTGEGFSANCITTGELYAITINACDILAANITSGKIKGVHISACTFDANTITGGTISGTEITGSTIKGNTITGGTITGTEIIGGTITGNTITGAKISTGEFNATNMKITGLEVGSNVTMGANATISWGQVTGNQDVVTIANIANHAITQMPTDLVHAADLVWSNIASKPVDLVTFTDMIWNNISGKPDIPSVALSAIRSTYMDGNGIWTPQVYATKINTYYGKIRVGLIEDLIVGSNVTMGPNAKITWANVTGGPNLTYIDGQGLYTGTVQASKITGSFILAQNSQVKETLNISNSSASANGIVLKAPSANGTIQFNYGGSQVGVIGYDSSFYGTFGVRAIGHMDVKAGSILNMTSGSTMNITSSGQVNITGSNTVSIKSTSSLNIDGTTMDARGTVGGYFGTTNAYLYGTGSTLKLNASSGVSTTGSMKVSGSLTATGTKPATILTENYGYRQLFSEEADKVYFSTKGLVETHLTTDSKYQYIIRLDEVFLQTIEPNSTNPYLVLLTPYSDARLWVKQVYDQYIIIESDKVTGFAYDVKCLRKYYSDYYLREVDFQNGEF